MSGAPFRSSLRNVAGDSKEGSNQSCWGTLVTVAELWLLALWEVLGLERSRWDAEHPLSKCQEHLWKLYDLCGQNTLPKHGSTSVERCSGSCGSCSQCIRATHCLVVYLKCQPCEILQGHPSLSLPSGLSLHYLRNWGTGGEREDSQIISNCSVVQRFSIG